MISLGGVPADKATYRGGPSEYFGSTASAFPGMLVGAALRGLFTSTGINPWAHSTRQPNEQRTVRCCGEKVKDTYLHFVCLGAINLWGVG